MADSITSFWPNCWAREPIDGFWFNINNTGITRFNFEEEGIGLAYANRLEHLPAGTDQRDT